MDISNINKKKVLSIIAIFICLILLGFAVYVYNVNSQFRSFVNKYILNKEIVADNLVYISIDGDSNTYVSTYDKYTVLVSKNELVGYIKNNEKFKLNISITTPIFSSAGKYLIIAENEGKKVYCIKDNQIVWERELDGNINNVYINEDGYAVVILSDSGYKSIAKVFKPDGGSLFNRYLSNNVFVECVTISTDNKYIAIAEINTSKIEAIPIVEVMSIDKVLNGNSDATVYTYETKDSNLIVDMRYIDKEKIVCMYDNKICILSQGNSTEVTNIDPKSTLFASINLKGNIVKAEKLSTGLFNSATRFKIININNNKENVYDIDGNVKSIKTNDNIIAINLGTEMHIINTYGWLVKRYISDSEIKDMHLYSDGLIVEYRNKLGIITY